MDKLQKEVKGRIKINGHIFETQCDCAKDAIIKKAQAIKDRRAISVKCQRPSKYSIFFDKHQKNASFDAPKLLHFMGPPSQLKWVNVSARTLSDVDGRRRRRQHAHEQLALPDQKPVPRR